MMGRDLHFLTTMKNLFVDPDKRTQYSARTQVIYENTKESRQH